MGVILFFGFSLIVIVGLTSLFKWQQSALTNTQIKEFNLKPEQKILVQYTFTAHHAGGMTIGFPVKAEMYLKDDCILIFPRKKDLLSGVIGYLPIVFTQDGEQMKNLTSVNNYFVPEQLVFFGMQSFRINYTRHMLSKVKVDVVVKILDKTKMTELQKLNTWVQDLHTA